MKKIFKEIIKHPRAVILSFFLMIGISVFFYPRISVNYNINDYLPEDSDSTLALDKMNSEYDEPIPNARIMIKNVSINEALAYIDKIENIKGVDSINWLDDIVDLKKPLDTYDKNLIDNYYKNKNALINVSIDEEKTISATKEIRKIIGENNNMTGSAVNTAVATESTVSEIRIITIVGVMFMIFALILTTESFIEPLIVVIGLFSAVIINAGTNIIFGEISFVTNAAGNVLQLAVSLDYSVFILHRYKEEKKKYKQHLKAMDEALNNSFSSIISSASTTIIGFFALCFMRFGIGRDLGLALAKGITISLVTVFTLTPVLILYMDKLIEKTEHRSFVPSFERFGKLVTRHMYVFVAIFVILVIPSYLASNSNSYFYGSSRIFNEETKLGQDTKEIDDVFGKNDNYVLLLPKGELEKEKELSKELKKISEVDTILSYVDTVGETIPSEFLDKDIEEKFNSKDYTRMIISVKADFEGEKTTKLIEKIQSKISKYYKNDYHLVGEGISTDDLRKTITEDMKVVNIIAIVAVFIVLLLTEKSISIPVILVLAIETAIFINLSIPYFMSSTVFYISYLIISTIQLGATVDYAILFTERYCETRKIYNKKEAIIETIKSSTVSILTSASTLTVVGFLLGKLSSHGILSQLGYFLGFGTSISLIIVLFVLPGLLSIFDKIIQKTSKDLDFKEVV
ncbi:MMPL family transporter [Anaerococcus sp. AGMB00486]|uniref:MMPL family transporter n=1 Tax=Anaerococcus faecalis TaxID=2742993 RepID=A0ABX2NAD7_9FIRM|nr:MMPL family transporter [Anaerococcus faecalis]NVF11605.1 MMPL family transporter [Anaerococcus faecalis]